MQLSVLIPEKISLNKIYAGIHFRQRSRHKDMYKLAVMASQPKKYKGPFPVAMHYHFKLSGPSLDISNHAYMVKMVEDAFVYLGVLPDDTPKYVSSISISAEKVHKTEPNTVDITIDAL